MVLSVANLVYRRAAGGPPVLDGIDLTLAPGEVLCLLGPNGSGKTTLLRCLIGALHADRGQVRIDGEPHVASRRLARKVAYVPQAAGDSGLQLLDIVLMGRTPHLAPLALIARALAQAPRLFLMDEPTASLDLGNQVRVLRTIRDLAVAGMSVLVTTHQPEHALLLDARVAAIAGGRIAAAGHAREVLQPDTLARLYGTPVDVVSHGGAPVACVPRL